MKSDSFYPIAWRRRAPSGLVGLMGLALVAIAASTAQAGPFTINAVFETSWINNAPAAATADVNAVIKEFEAAFTNPVTITIQFGWGDVASTAANPGGIAIAGGAAAYFPQLYTANPAQYTLAQTEKLMTDHAAAHPENQPINTAAPNLPMAYLNPGGSTNFFVSDAEYKALTGKAQNTDAIDGYVGVAAKDPWSFGAAAGAAGTEYFRGALEHEITHDMGRFDAAYLVANGGNPAYLTPLDFYKINANNANLDPTRSVTRFSIDGGKTFYPGYTFNASSDTSDWNNLPDNSFNTSLATFQSMTPTDLVEMQALGWDPAVPEPGTWLLLGTGILGLLACAGRTRRGRSGVAN